MLPAEHWFVRLGRSLTIADGATALVSWSGTMFEYLMPLLVMPPRPFSFSIRRVTRPCTVRSSTPARAALPWGISESAYNVRDRHDTPSSHQRLRRCRISLSSAELASDLVVAPYATALAIAVISTLDMRRYETLRELERRGCTRRVRVFTTRSTIRA